MSEPDVSQLMSVAEAAAILDAVPVTPTVEHVPLEQALGRRLARAVTTDRDYPPVDKSLMDGYVARVGEASGRFDVVADLAPGDVAADVQLSGREAAYIMTGGPLPAGDLGVVPVEQASRDNNTVHLSSSVEPDRFIARRGSDRPAGVEVLPQGLCLRAHHIAALATVGCASVPVYTRPRVAIIATGGELVASEDTPGTTQVRDANTPLLAGLLQSLGCQVVARVRVGDDRKDLDAAVTDLQARADALFISGGMSMGDRDHAVRLMRERTQLRIQKLRIRPGKPFAFGTTEDGPLFFGLPGNPVSAFVCTFILASRVLHRMGGGGASYLENHRRPVSLAEGVPANGPRQFYQPATLTVDGRAMPLRWRGSADVFTLGQADLLLERPADAPAADAGSDVPAYRLD